MVSHVLWPCIRCDSLLVQPMFWLFHHNCCHPKGLTLDFHGDISIPTYVPTRHNHIETGLPAGDVIHQFALVDITIFPMISNHPITFPKPTQKSQYDNMYLHYCAVYWNGSSLIPNMPSYVGFLKYGYPNKALVFPMVKNQFWMILG